jgi:hypothetical protein
MRPPVGATAVTRDIEAGAGVEVKVGAGVEVEVGAGVQVEVGAGVQVEVNSLTLIVGTSDGRNGMRRTSHGMRKTALTGQM